VFVFFYVCELDLLGVSAMEQWNYNCSNYSSPGTDSSVIVNYASGQVSRYNSQVNPIYNQAVPLSEDVFRINETHQKWLRLTRQRQIDEEFLNRFCKSRERLSVAKQETTVKIHEFKELANEAQKLINQLEKDGFPSHPCPPDELANLQAKRERLNFVMEQLKNPAAIATVKKELTKRKRKREWIKRRKLNLKQEAEEAIAKRSEMTREIDDKREMIRQKHAGKIRDLETRREAELVLSEVRRKQNEANRLTMLLKSLKELRRLRAGSSNNNSDKDNADFNNTIDGLEKLIAKQVIVYGKEEETLKIMMDTQEKKEPDNNRKQWNKYLVRGMSF